MSYTDKQFQRLPKWAQHELRRLQGNEKYLTDKLNKALGQTKTRVEIGPYNDTICYLDERETVRYKLSDHWEEYVDVRFIEQRPGDMRLEVRGGTGSLTIHPNAGNILHVKAQKGY